MVAEVTYIPVSDVANQGALTLSDFALGQPDVIRKKHRVYLRDLNYPTHNYTLGFLDGSGDLLTDNDGDVLTQDFALSIHGSVVLNPGDQPGDYQFATLSDDGSIFYVKPHDELGDWDWDRGHDHKLPLVSNDGTHPNTLGCATRTVDMHVDRPLRFDLDYFQGPEYSISLVLMWRHAPTTLSDPLCGVAEDDTFYYTGNPPAPTGNYQTLLNDGWSPVPAANLYLPHDRRFCRRIP